jgi:hypothetical protein
MKSRRETKRAWRIRRFEEAMHSLVSRERIDLVLCSCFAVSEMKRWNFQNFELIKCLNRKVLQDISKFSIENVTYKFLFQSKWNESSHKIEGSSLTWSLVISHHCLHHRHFNNCRVKTTDIMSYCQQEKHVNPFNPSQITIFRGYNKYWVSVN